VANIVFIAIISLSALFINLNTAVLFVSFGALTAFTFVNLSVIAHYYIKLKRRSVKETFLYLIFPLIGASFIGWLLTLLNKNTLIIGLAWVSLGFVYLFIKTIWTNAKERKYSVSTTAQKNYVR
jgi:putrescine importer